MLKTQTQDQALFNASHWSQRKRLHTLTFRLDPDRPVEEEADRVREQLCTWVSGGSDRGQLVHASRSFPASEACHTTLTVDPEDIIIDVESHQVSGFTRKDAVEWMTQCAIKQQGVVQLTTTHTQGEFHVRNT